MMLLWLACQADPSSKGGADSSPPADSGLADAGGADGGGADGGGQDGGEGGELSACASELRARAEASGGQELEGWRSWPAVEGDGRWFEEQGEAWGLSQSELPEGDHARGGVAAVHDFNGDDLPDLVLGYSGEPMRFCSNEGAAFSCTDISDTNGQDPLTLADLDGDGRLELISAGPPPVVVAGAGFPYFVGNLDLPRGLSVVDLSPGDFDQDGWMDLLATASGDLAGAPETRADVLLRGDPDEQFLVEALDPEQASGVGFDGLVADLDGDGDSDAYTINDFGPTVLPNARWENVDGALQPSADETCNVACLGMGADAQDVDGDGLLDLYIAAAAANRLLTRSPDGGCVDSTAAASADPLESDADMSWGAVFWDLDDDGDLDLAIARGDQWAPEDLAPRPYDSAPTLLVNRPEGGQPRYTDESSALGLSGLGSYRAVIPADFDGDGREDLLMTDVRQRPLLWMARGDTGNGAIELELPGPGRVEACVDGALVRRLVSTESGWGGARSPRLRLGLGAGAEPELLVWWPGT